MFTRKKGFTLIEMMISISLFAVVASISMVVTSNILKTTKKIQAQVFLYTEAQALMDQLDQEVNRNAIDYEAYYGRTVGHQGTPDTGWATVNYGDYQQTFMDPGTQSIPSSTDGVYSGVDGYGSACSATGGTYPDDCSTSIPLTASLDLDTGAHPFPDIDTIVSSRSDDETYSNAMCENASTCSAITHYTSDELILINGGGDRRTIFEEVSNGLSKVVLDGADTDNDGSVDHWTCTSDYSCSGSDYDDGPADTSEFETITPSLLSITSFYVYVAPIEDPYRAFAEDSLAVQIQPQVTIVFTATLSSAYGTFLGTTPSITLQRTISTGVYSKINSYAE